MAVSPMLNVCGFRPRRRLHRRWHSIWGRYPSRRLRRVVRLDLVDRVVHLGLVDRVVRVGLWVQLVRVLRLGLGRLGRRVDRAVQHLLVVLARRAPMGCSVQALLALLVLRVDRADRVVRVVPSVRARRVVRRFLDCLADRVFRHLRVVLVVRVGRVVRLGMACMVVE